VHGNRDIYYRRAKETGYRARSAYKLLQVHELHTIFTPDTQRVVDLCAAPGSWSQVAVELMPSAPPADSSSSTSSKPRVIAVDLQEMAPIPGVHIVQGDVTALDTVQSILAYFDQQPVDIVLCDGAPDVTGVHTLDEHMQSQLLNPVLHITTHMLRPGGSLVCKVFKDAGYEWLDAQLRVFFEFVECVKPSSSRIRSAEHFVVCKGFNLPVGYVLRPMLSPAERLQQAEAAGEGAGGEEESDEMRLTEAIDAYLRCGDYNPHQRLRAATIPAVAPPSDQYTQLVSEILANYA
jgi:tRNA (cytidine32/guanosine34-2'-O)-methyltransferase